MPRAPQAPTHRHPASLAARRALAALGLLVCLLSGTRAGANATDGAWGPVIPWPHIAVSAANLPDGRVRPPFDQPYLQREFHVIDEDGTLVFFGEDIRPRP